VNSPSVRPDAEAPAPDAIQPIVGYRAWRYEPNDAWSPLHPMARRPGEVWRAGGWTQARCLAGGLSAYVRRSREQGRHPAPQEGCTCGLYAMRGLDELLIDLATLGIPVIAWTGVILGRVELAGKVIEHDRGYRAERGRVAELFSSPARLEVPFAVAATYDVPVTDIDHLLDTVRIFDRDPLDGLPFPYGRPRRPRSKPTDSPDSSGRRGIRALGGRGVMRARWPRRRNR
jgi:hypothetical protein